MKKSLLTVALGLSLVACSGIKKDYIVTDASYLPQPKWVKKGKYKASKSDEYKYFISSGDNVSKRLCEKTANARANLVVSQEIAQSIDDAYKNTINSNGNEATESASEKLQQTVKLYLAGVENEESYWEKRQYLKKKGATEDLTKYQCYSLVKMKKTNYNNAVSKSVDKMMSSLDVENKKEVAETIKNEVMENEEN